MSVSEMWCKIMLAKGNNCYYCRIKNVEKVGFMKEKFSRIAMGDISEVSDPSSVKDLYISSTGRIWDFYESEPFFIFDGIVIGLYLKGVASVKINGRRYEIKPYSVLLLPPNELLEVESGSSDADRKSLIASTDVIFEYPTPIDTGILSLARRMPVARVSEKQMSRLMDTFDLLEKKYSVKEVDELIKRKKAEWEKQRKKDDDEAKKFAKMNAQEKAEYKKQQLEKRIQELEDEKTLSGMRDEARKQLSEKGINISDNLLEFMVSKDAEKTKKAVDSFAELFNSAVNEAVKAKARQTTPRESGRFSGGKDGVNLKEMAKEARIIK